ncbi:MAG: cupin domain-containing protein [Luteolibacter sp.]|uniref:cupin domain-containing protein n=1 Tax=Luteolibacter sp. TaxID=1962973 RepID=UPI003265BE0D
MKKPFILNADVIDESNAWTRNEFLCRPDMTGAEKLLMVRATMPPRGGHPFHIHPHREEIIHVVEGRAEQWVGNEYRILGPGEIAFIPAGIAHATYNPFDETLVFHAILSPAKLDATEELDEDPLDISHEEPWKSIRGA